MCDKIQLKVQFEGNQNVFSLEILQKNGFKEQMDQFVKLSGMKSNNPNEENPYHLYNLDTNLYILSFNDLQTGKNKKTQYIMKNCLLDAKNLVEELIQIDFSQNNNTSDSTCSGSSGSTKKPDIKNIMFHLKNYLSVDVFVEEFIQYEGIKYLVKAIEETTGNTRSYAINALKTLFEYVS